MCRPALLPDSQQHLSDLLLDSLPGRACACVHARVRALVDMCCRKGKWQRVSQFKRSAGKALSSSEVSSAEFQMSTRAPLIDRLPQPFSGDQYKEIQARLGGPCL